jgi:FMN phosphatase YigB (HAD superfamily)
MSNILDLRQAANLFGGSVSEGDLCALDVELRHEIESISLFPDAVPTLTALKDRGIKVALCSNLAAPYGPPVLKLLPFQPDFCAWSYEAKAVKPQPAMYRYLCDGLACRPNEILMVGDTVEADVTGPREFGMYGYHLDRRFPAMHENGSLHTLGEVIPLVDKAS